MNKITGAPGVSAEGLTALGIIILIGALAKLGGMAILNLMTVLEKRKIAKEYWESDGAHGDFEQFKKWKEAQK